MTTAPSPDVLERLAERTEALRKLAHDAPLNPYRLDASGHRWVEQQSYAWARTGRAWMDACDELARAKAALAQPQELGR